MSDSTDMNDGLDAGARKILEILADAAKKGVPGLHEVSPEQARAMNLRSKELFGSEGPDVATTDLQMDGPDGPISARLYRPAAGVLPVIVYYHGGGWVIGSLETHDGLCRHLAEKAQAVVVSVDYRLAPETSFPGPVEDCYAALRWTVTNAAEYELDASKIVVSGDSAGGNLAAVVALMAREEDGPSIAFQALLYPATDMNFGTESFRTFTQHLLTQEAMHYFREHYLRDDQDRDDWRASPLLASDLSGLPPAYVLTAGFDPLRDEGRAYADAMAAAGVDVTYRCFDGQIHGFLTLDKIIPEALVAVDEIAAAINTHFAQR